MKPLRRSKLYKMFSNYVTDKSSQKNYFNFKLGCFRKKLNFYILPLMQIRHCTGQNGFYEKTFYFFQEYY
jgi:hypothetical protein